ncbi:hypothetical protein LMG26846_05354 [Achromobacter insuavis]|uniref:hypothetical protein n=1 Tax=Achromobacter insuavis TaxID=1287735 RepID=UPI00146903DB|nr:hypothetical protein [Achromobacter insuavis]CAB3917175.1 hypothetical protein LMG26846_05354 [Achromobacter insuavis]
MAHITNGAEASEFAEPDVERTLAFFKQIGFMPPVHASDGDLPGREFAGRAEIKLATLRPDEPLGVSSPIPPESKTFFMKLAQFRQEMQVITDPTGTYVFEPGAEPEHIPHPEAAAPRKAWWKFW